VIFIIKLDYRNPHPHAFIKQYSSYPNEDEVLLFPIFPVKEIGRKKKNGFTYIKVEQD